MASLSPWTGPMRAVAFGTLIFLLAGCGGSSTPETAQSASTQPTWGSPPSASSQPAPSTTSGASSSSGTSPASSAMPAPTLSGSPPTTVAAGQLYSFKPISSNPEGRILSFIIQNKPKWAGFNTSTGQLSGTPAAIDTGTDSNIVISVNDGAATAALKPFAIQVAQDSISRVTLTWMAPTENTDGESVSHLVGYRIHYGTSPTQLTSTVDINNVDVLTYVLSNLKPGTWYFAVAAMNSDNIESNLSSIGNATI